MMPFEKRTPVKRYAEIDHDGEGCYWSSPGDGEVFTADLGYFGDHAQPFIEVSKGGRVLRTVNCLVIAEIEFVADELPEVDQ